MKKKLPLIILVVVIVGLGGFFVLRGKKANSQDQTQKEQKEKKRITEPINIIPVEERPYMQIKPLADGHHIVIALNDLKKPADQYEYELEYQSGSLLQGAFDQVDLEELPTEHKLMLGSCSAGGACTYHEDIKGGSLLTRFSQGENKYVLKSDWRYLENKDDETQISSRDGKFQLESEDLANESYLIVFNSPGYPESLENQALSEFYTLSSAGSLSGKGELTIRASEESKQAIILGYDGEEWIEFEAQVDGKKVTADVELLAGYLVVKK
ncbi:MAG: hypothetical protein U9O78_00825 [Patescibacteria group bacterium]|nr:hypothetical protein [Patescibacteria group bacterium]